MPAEDTIVPDRQSPDCARSAIFMTTPVNASVICPVLIGRTFELASLHTLLEQALDGHGQVALLCGEAGVGKSRLVAEVRTAAVDMGFSLLQGSCFQTDHATPYGPFRDLVGSSFIEASTLFGSFDLLSFVQHPSSVQRDENAQVLEHEVFKGSSQDIQQEQLHLFATMLRLVTEQAARQPLLFIIEDLHWSDEASLELLRHLARKCAQSPILFVLTYRSDEVTPELRHFLAVCDRDHLSQEISLQRLSRAETSTMLQAIFPGQQAVSTGLLESLYPLTEGNPFFIEEALKSLLTTGELANREGSQEWVLRLDRHTWHISIPRSVQDAVYQRTKQLSVPAKHVLTLAAVAGRHFALPVLQWVTQFDESQLLLYMKELVAAQLISEETADRFSFRHALTRQAVYTELLAGERRALHRSLAMAIEQQVSLTAALDSWVEDLAYHFYEGEVWTQAAEYGQRAGERALLLYAPRAAIEHLSHTLDSLSRTGNAPPASVLRARGQAYATIGSFEQAREDYAQALSLARGAKDSLLEWQSLIDLGFLWAERDYAQAGQWFRDALDLTDGLTDPTLRAHSLNRVGNWLVNTGRVADGLQAHQEALTLFDGLQSSQGLTETSDLLGMAYGISGDSMQAVVQYDRAIHGLRALDDRQGLISSLTSRAAYASLGWVETTFSACESSERWSRDIEEALRLARRVDSLSGQAFAEWVYGLALATSGQLSQSLVHAQESLRLATEIEHPQWLAAAHFTLGRIYHLLLEANLAAQAFERGLALARDIGSSWWVGNISAYLAQTYLLLGKLPRAEAALLAVAPPEKQPMNSTERRIYWSWGELALATGKAEEALNIAELLLASSPAAPTEQPIPWLLKLKGEALGALSRPAESIQSLEEARRGALARQEQPVVWQIDRALGREYRRSKNDNLARRHFTLAREGITALAETVEDTNLRERFLQAALATVPKGRPISSRRAAKEAAGGLTIRERTVVEMVAQGKSNREIADALVVTKRTVETHISNIKHKLALTSRAQLAVWAVERGMLER
jgi:DNA-binding CsgD family transcriptional regulator/tetratricopeptide (TPR) repeat protein